MTDLNTSCVRRLRLTFASRRALLLTLALACFITARSAALGAAWPAPASAGPAVAPAGITTTISVNGAQGNAQWYVSPVTVGFTTDDPGATAATLYRLNQANWLTYTVPFRIDADGVHMLDYFSIDMLGTAEMMRTTQVAVDATAPSSAIDGLAGYYEAISFLVVWTGGDGDGSGLAAFDVHYRDGLLGTWTPWLTATANLSALFSVGQRGHTYYFRTRAHDAAGNVEAWPAGNGDASTYIDSVRNGGFELGSFDGWTVTGEMSKSIALASTAGGSGAWSALLGSPAYGDSITPTAALHVPTNTMATIAQVIRVPSLLDMPAPALSLWYRVQTYDVVWGCAFPDELYDSFDIVIRDTSGVALAMPVRDGNYDCLNYNAYNPLLIDIAMERVLDLTPYAGRTIIIELSNANRHDWSFNTWTYVDSVRVLNQPTRLYRVHMPHIGVNNTVSLPDRAPPLTGGMLPSGQPPRR